MLVSFDVSLAMKAIKVLLKDERKILVYNEKESLSQFTEKGKLSNNN